MLYLVIVFTINLQYLTINTAYRFHSKHNFMNKTQIITFFNNTLPCTLFLYFQYVYDHIPAIIFWCYSNAIVEKNSNLHKKVTKKIQTIQNKCVRFCLNLENRTHVGVNEFKNVCLPGKDLNNVFVCVHINYSIMKDSYYMSDIFNTIEKNIFRL